MCCLCVSLKHSVHIIHFMFKCKTKNHIAWYRLCVVVNLVEYISSANKGGSDFHYSIVKSYFKNKVKKVHILVCNVFG